MRLSKEATSNAQKYCQDALGQSFYRIQQLIQFLSKASLTVKSNYPAKTRESLLEILRTR